MKKFKCIKTLSLNLDGESIIFTENERYSGYKIDLIIHEGTPYNYEIISLSKKVIVMADIHMEEHFEMPLLYGR